MRIAPEALRRASIAWLIAAVGAQAAAQQGVTLTELAELAKTRAAKLRPELEKKLEPFLDALSKSYKSDFVVIDEKIEEIVKLGDSIIPLLLEKLEPRRESPKSRNLADNCARVLAEMEPASFLDALLEIAEGENYTGIGKAIPLLGQTESPRAGALLTRMLDRLDQYQASDALVALTKLEHKGAVLKVAKGLPYDDTDYDRLATRYLATIKSPVVVPEAIRAIGEVKRVSRIMRYVRLIGDCAETDAETAHSLLPLYDNQKLDVAYWTEITNILARIAPENDRKTINRLKKVIGSGKTGTLELRAALALKKLGDKSGPAALKRTLVDLVKSSKTKRDYLHHSNLGDYYLEFGDYKLAVRSYENAERLTTSPSVRSMLFIQIARAQARRSGKHREVRNALRDSKATLKRLMEAAQQDPALAKAYEHPTVKKYLDSFPK